MSATLIVASIIEKHVRKGGGPADFTFPREVVVRTCAHTSPTVLLKTLLCRQCWTWEGWKRCPTCPRDLGPRQVKVSTLQCPAACIAKRKESSLVPMLAAAPTPAGLTTEALPCAPSVRGVTQLRARALINAAVSDYDSFCNQQLDLGEVRLCAPCRSHCG